MAIEKTLFIVKPDSVKKGNIGKIIAKVEGAGFNIAAAKMIHMTPLQAELFYAIHKTRPFFGELVDFMISGPVVVCVLEAENAVLKNRELMGATDPKQSPEGSLRAMFGESIGINAVHGSDSVENAELEISIFFSKNELVNSDLFKQ